MVKDIYVFPAKFQYAEDGISIFFPDLPGCLPCAETDEEALKNATEALELHLWSLERDDDPIPEPTPVNRISVGPNEVVVLIRANMKLARKEINGRSVRKMVTLPKWLNDVAEEHRVNFSRILQEALQDYLGIERRAG